MMKRRCLPALLSSIGPVSYTHLDVYKRQEYSDSELMTILQTAKAFSEVNELSLIHI